MIYKVYRSIQKFFTKVGRLTYGYYRGEYPVYSIYPIELKPTLDTLIKANIPQLPTALYINQTVAIANDGNPLTRESILRAMSNHVALHDETETFHMTLIFHNIEGHTERCWICKYNWYDGPDILGIMAAYADCCLTESSVQSIQKYSEKLRYA